MAKKESLNDSVADSKLCGLVMPISAMPDCSHEHWSDVRDIITRAIGEAGFVCQMVSEADDIGIIHSRIVNNIYGNPIVVCDVSGKNPNVMFELGMRLAFDKPVIIVKDDKTDYSFDTGIIEHIEYPRDLRHGKIEEFIVRLSKSIQKTYTASMREDYISFMKNFKEIKVSKIDTQDATAIEALLEKQDEMQRDIRSIFMQLAKVSAPRVVLKRRMPKSVVESNLRRDVEGYCKANGIEEYKIDVDDFIDAVQGLYKDSYSREELHNMVSDMLIPF